MTLGQLAWVINDTALKLAADRLGLFQVVVLRGALVVAALSAWLALRRTPRQVLWPLPGLVWVRIGAEMVTTVCFLLALVQLDIGDVAAIMQFVPLGITLAAATFLGERVRWPRYLAVVGGFIGVMMVIRPGTAEFSPAAVLLLGAVVGVIIRDLSTRRLPAHTPSLVVAWATAIASLALGTTAVVGGAQWQPITLPAMGLVAVAASAIIAGMLLAILTVRVGEMSFASPFRYTSIVWAMISQVVFFAVLPDRWSIAGATLIVTMGLFAMYRERQSNERRRRGVGPTTG